MPAACCFPIAADMTLEQAAVVEPLSIGVYAVRQSIAMQGARVGVLGCGPIGLSVMLSALHEGAGTVYVTDKIEARLDVARRAGAAWTGNPDAMDVVGEIREQQPELLDVVFDCCGQQEALDQAVALLKPGGKLMAVGIPTTERVSFEPDAMRRKELTIQNVRRQNGCMQAALDMVERGDVNVDFMITHRFPFSAAKEAFDIVSAYADGVVKAMIYPDEAATLH